MPYKNNLLQDLHAAATFIGFAERRGRDDDDDDNNNNEKLDAMRRRGSRRFERLFRTRVDVGAAKHQRGSGFRRQRRRRSGFRRAHFRRRPDPLPTRRSTPPFEELFSPFIDGVAAGVRLLLSSSVRR